MRDPLDQRLCDDPADPATPQGRVARHLRNVIDPRSLRLPGADRLREIGARLPVSGGKRRLRIPRLAWLTVGLCATALAIFGLRGLLRSPSRAPARATTKLAGSTVPRLRVTERLSAPDQVGEGTTDPAPVALPGPADGTDDPATSAASARPSKGVSCRGFSPGADFAACTATYVGGSGADTPAGVEIAGDESVVLAAMIEGTDLGAPVRVLLGGGRAAIVRFARGGREVLSVSRVGDAIHDLALLPGSDDIAIVGEPFGLAVLDAKAETVRFRQGVLGRRVAAGSDGTIAVLDTGHGVVTVFGRDGGLTKTFDIEVPRGFATDVAVHGGSASVYVTGGIPGAPEQPFLRAYSYDGTLKWQNYGWTAEEAHRRSFTASAAGVAVAIGRDDKLYYLGRCTGGNSTHTRDPRNLAAKLPTPAYDRFTDPHNVGNQTLAFAARMDPADGTLEAGQSFLTRDELGKGRSMIPTSIAADEHGNVLVGGAQACCMDGQNEKFMRGARLRGGKRDAFALGISPDFGKRWLWTTWSNGGGRSNAVGVSIRNGVAALTAAQEKIEMDQGPLLTVDALQPRPGGGASDAFLSVFPSP